MVAMTTVELLERARKLITRGYCYGEHACDAQGQYVHAAHESAVAWSSYGALEAAEGPLGPRGATAAAFAEAVALLEDEGIRWLNRQTRVEVLAFFDGAIEVAKVPNQARRPTSERQ